MSLDLERLASHGKSSKDVRAWTTCTEEETQPRVPVPLTPSIFIAAIPTCFSRGDSTAKCLHSNLPALLIHMASHFDVALWLDLINIHKAKCMHAKTLQSCPTLCNPMDCSPPGSSVHGILQARILEWGCHFLLRETQGLNPGILCLLHWQAGSIPLVPPGKR